MAVNRLIFEFCGKKIRKKSHHEDLGYFEILVQFFMIFQYLTLVSSLTRNTDQGPKKNLWVNDTCFGMPNNFFWQKIYFRSKVTSGSMK